MGLTLPGAAGNQCGVKRDGCCWAALSQRCKPPLLTAAATRAPWAAALSISLVAAAEAHLRSAIDCEVHNTQFKGLILGKKQP